MATGFGKIFGDGEPESDLISPVDPADIQSVWTMQHEFQARFPNEGLVISADIYKQACRPGAHVGAVCERTSQLGLLQMLGVLSSWLRDGVLDDAVFQVLATIAMKRMQVGVVYNKPPFDVDEFIKQVEERIQG
jgi:hypothetical protein